MTKKQKTQLIRKCLSRLEKAYPDAKLIEPTPPLEQLLKSIIQYDTNLGKAENALRMFEDEFVDWNEVRVSSVAELARVLGSAGVDTRKARIIKSVLSQLFLKKNQLSLDFLKKYQPKQAHDFLKRFEVIPMPVIDEVMLLSLGHPCFPLGTNVYRVCLRLGIIEEDEERDHDAVSGLIPKTFMVRAYVLFDKHGQMVCKSRAPACKDCVLRSDCEFYANRSKAKASSRSTGARDSGSKKKKTARKAAGETRQKRARKTGTAKSR